MNIEEKPKNKWVLPSYEAGQVQALSSVLGVSLPLAQVLWHRGYKTPPQSWHYLHPSLDTLKSVRSLPMLRDILQAVLQLMESGASSSVLIYSDFDTDGICGGAILYSLLSFFGKKPHFLLPHRLEEGYGLHEKIFEVVHDRGIQTVLTVDVGTNEPEIIQRLSEQGIRVLVIDHHECSVDRRPDVSIFNPKLLTPPVADSRTSPGNSSLDISSLQELTSAGLCFLVALFAVEARLPSPGSDPSLKGGYWNGETKRLLTQALELATLGTLADVGGQSLYNRVMTWYGLQALSAPTTPALRTFMSSHPNFFNTLQEYLSFRIIPALNACGRMGDPTPAFELLIASEEEDLKQRWKAVERINRQRQRKEKQALAVIAPLVEQNQREYLYIHHPDIPVGILSILSTRLCHQTRKPVFVSTEAGPGTIKGSCRSLHYPVLPFLQQCDQILLKYGGHQHAAGFTLSSGRLAQFQDQLERIFPSFSSNDAADTHSVDAEVSLEQIQGRFLEELRSLEPFGRGNAVPLLLCRRVEGYGQPAQDKEGWTFHVKQGSHLVRARWMHRRGPAPAWGEGQGLDILFSPKKAGASFTFPREEIFLDVVDWRPSGS